MEVMHALDVHDEAASIFGIALDKGAIQATGNTILVRDDTRTG
jgi:hypothetical protein